MRAAATDDNVMNVGQQRGRPVGTGDRGAEGRSGRGVLQMRPKGTPGQNLPA